jgi:UDP-GlcNAc:undecaprenyl-phosphate/decaprenyl-phosphate GlcNAc-1-phosphate transferase
MAGYLPSLIAFATTALLIVLLRPLAVATGLVDIPNERKSHRAPTPLVGGLAIFAGLVVSFLVAGRAGLHLPGREIVSFFGAGLLLVAVGVVDDFLELSPAVRFVAQILAALLMVFGAGVVLTDLGAMTWAGTILPLGVLSIPFTVFATLGVINALNMCDGLDGLSGSLALVSLGGLLVAASLWGVPGQAAFLPPLGAAIVGFLLFNLRLPGRSQALVFMGDAGSMFLGFALTWYAISLSQGEARVIRPSAALWFLMLPIFDAVSMMLRRTLRGRSPFAPDREHLHHIFLLAGYSVNQTVGIMTALALVGVLVALASIYWEVPELLVSGGFLVVGLGYFWMITHAWRVMRFLHRSINRRRGPGDRRRSVDPHYAGPERRIVADRRASGKPGMELPRGPASPESGRPHVATSADHGPSGPVRPSTVAAAPRLTARSP